MFLKNTEIQIPQFDQLHKIPTLKCDCIKSGVFELGRIDDLGLFNERTNLHMISVFIYLFISEMFT